MNSDIIENPYELKKFKQIYHEADFRLVDIGWWNEKVVFNLIFISIKFEI